MNERERIELLMKCYELTSSQFADRTGIQRASVSHIISGRNKPSLEVMQKIYEAFPELDLKWLMTGAGEEPVAGRYGGNDTAIPENSLFAQQLPELRTVASVAQAAQTVQTSQPYQYAAPQESEQPAVRPQQAPKPIERQRKSVVPKMRQQSVVERRIKEIRIFYTDGTYETLIPEK